MSELSPQERTNLVALAKHLDQLNRRATTTILGELGNLLGVDLSNMPHLLKLGGDRSVGPRGGRVGVDASFGGLGFVADVANTDPREQPHEGRLGLRRNDGSVQWDITLDALIAFNVGREVAVATLKTLGRETQRHNNINASDR